MENANNQDIVTAKPEETFAANVGLDYTTLISYAAIDASKQLSKGEKRDMLYSCLCLRCLFDNRMAVEPDPILKKYDCLTMPEPQKLDLYELVNKIVLLDSATVAVKAMWFLVFPYVIMIGAPYDEELSESIVSAVTTDEVFTEVLQSKYSLYTPVSAGEMLANDLPTPVINWVLPYLDYLAIVNADGLNKMHEHLRRDLALGRHEQVFARTELLLNTFSDDEEYMLINIAARSALFTNRTPAFEGIIPQTLELLNGYINQNTKRKIFFIYYRGLTYLALMQLNNAKTDFADCLTLDPTFQLATLMLKALDNH